MVFASKCGLAFAVVLGSAAAGQTPSGTMDQISASSSPRISAPFGTELPRNEIKPPASFVGVLQTPQSSRDATGTFIPQIPNANISAVEGNSLGSLNAARTLAMEVVGGIDRCAQRSKKSNRLPICLKKLESATADLSTISAATITPEQRLILDQQLRDFKYGTENAIRQLANAGRDNNSLAVQGIASVYLQAPPPPAKKDVPDRDAADASLAAAIVSAIVNQSSPPPAMKN